MSASFVFEFDTNNHYAMNSISEPTKITKLRWSEATRTLIVDCEDGHSRLCRVDRLVNPDDKSVLADLLRLARMGGRTVRFIASGNNNPNKWFCGFMTEGEV